MNKTIFRIVIAIIIGGGAIYYFTSIKPAYEAPANINASSTTDTKSKITSSPVKTDLKSFTATEVAKHNSETSCYTIIRGNVYDVTAFIPKHPGGTEPILTGCGIDNTDVFVKKHGGKEKQETLLETMKIGVLATQ